MLGDIRGLPSAVEIHTSFLNLLSRNLNLFILDTHAHTHISTEPCSDNTQAQLYILQVYVYVHLQNKDLSVLQQKQKSSKSEHN